MSAQGGEQTHEGETPAFQVSTHPGSPHVSGNPLFFTEGEDEIHSSFLGELNELLEGQYMLDPPLTYAPEVLDDDEDDGLYGERAVTPSLDLSDDGSFGDDEEVNVAADAFVWKIDHTKGQHKLKVTDFLSTIGHDNFDGLRALDMIQEQYTIDYGSRKAGGRRTQRTDQFYPSFFLDMIIIVGRPLQPITQSSAEFFDNVTISFKNWRASYSNKHSDGLSFDLKHRTFRLATGAGRESWFVVMHPAGDVVRELPAGRRRQRQQAEDASRNSALQEHHAQFLMTYIKNLFLLDDLLGEGVEPAWRLDGPQAQNITFNKWAVFQQCFMANWLAYVALNTTDAFWSEHQPAFHAYDYGANIEIEVNDYLQRLPPEVSLRQREESGSDDSSMESDNNDDNTEIREHRLHHSNSQGIPGFETIPQSHDMAAPHRGSSGSGLVGDNVTAVRHYPAGLAELHKALTVKYRIESIDSFSFALAVNISCTDTTAIDAGGRPSARCLLADRNLVAQEYRGARDFTFYPLAFHPVYGNFSSIQPPAFLNNHLLAIMKDNMSFRNGGADPLKFGYFQAYSNIKRSIRHGPDDLLASKGIATAALTIPASETRGSGRLRAKHHRLQQHFFGQLTPEDPDSSRPFVREQRRIESALEVEEFAFRMEQVVSVQVKHLRPQQRHFANVLEPILQILRFFLKEPKHYTHLLRSFQPSSFPGVLSAYARLFNVALDDLAGRIDISGGKGLNVGLAEGIAALDRLGSYCFTGFPKSLMGSVLKPLGTIESIEHCGWPYINPRYLDLRSAPVSLNIVKWPRGLNDRPILMHVAALAYHYGPAIAISRHNRIWFQELGGQHLTGPSGITKHLEGLFEDLWIPEMVAFIKHQIQRRLQSNHALSGSDNMTRDQQNQLLETWADSQYPFSWKEYEPIVLNLIISSADATKVVSTKTRHDLALEVYRHCIGKSEPIRSGLTSANATWLSVLRHTVQHSKAAQMSTQHWVAAISAAMLSNRIECMPGTLQLRLCHRRVVRLVGYTQSAHEISAPVGTLRQAAMEAQHWNQRPNPKTRIDFHCAIPFTITPDLVTQGFDRQEAVFRNGDKRILEHYQVARNCLKECLGDPLCDLMLMLVLTLASSSAIPTVPVGKYQFEAGKKRDSAHFAACLVTRMLWTLRPQHFMATGKRGSMLSISEMTKKIEHTGVNNRLLRELKWIKVVKGNRDTPRNTEIELQDRSELLRMRKTLMGLLNDPTRFIQCVFHSQERIWVDRCAEIISEQD